MGEATRVAERIGDELRDPFVLDERETLVTASIGVAIGGTTTTRPEELLREADLAMYQAKRTGKAHSVVFDPNAKES